MKSMNKLHKTITELRNKYFNINNNNNSNYMTCESVTAVHDDIDDPI